LHIFDDACNLVNERREVLSIVTPQIGDGPFNLVIEDDACFSDHLQVQLPVSVHADQLRLGDLTIHTAGAKLWSPRPDWETLHGMRDGILDRLTSLPITDYQLRGLDTPFATIAQGYVSTGSTRRSTIAGIQSLISDLPSALALADVPACLTIASRLAGLGYGLTPAGDDFMLGGLLAAWILHPPELAGTLAAGMANTAAPLTTSLSAAWLRAAGKGEAGILWHEFFQALISADQGNVRATAGKILAVGETSGADALAGFIGAWSCRAESATLRS
jgi:hypothetical protein